MSLPDYGCRVVLVGMLGLLCLATTTADGQTLRSHGPDRASAGQEVALYMDWERSTAFQGGVLSLPEGWRLLEARLVEERSGYGEVRVRSIDGPGAQYMVIPARVQSGPRTLIVRAITPEAFGAVSWMFVPYDVDQSEPGSIRLVEDLSGRVDGSVVLMGRPQDENRALVVDPEGAPLVLDGRALPEMDAGSAFTVEAWMKTSVTGQVVLSTWTGNEDDAYSAEVIVDATGRAVFFQGMRGDHRSLRSEGRVADGAWHHVAVSHDPERNWTRLIVDGNPADSLQHGSPLFAGTPEQVVLGGRPSVERALFEGEIDEFRVWAVARTPEMIRSTAFRQLQQPAAGAVFISFNNSIAENVLASRTEALTVPTDLVFRQALSDLTVNSDEGGVTLTWRALTGRFGRLEVERSADGHHYQLLGSVPVETGRPLGSGESEFSYQDLGAGDRVLYYRIRHVRPVAQDLVSNPVKVGRTEAVEPPRLAVLEGSFPNPFNPTTTIRYSLVEGQVVNVSVWDLAGQLVSTLASGFQEAGEHTVPFSADNLPSGTYFVRLRSPEGMQSHPILLMK